MAVKRRDPEIHRGPQRGLPRQTHFFVVGRLAQLGCGLESLHDLDVRLEDAGGLFGIGC